MPITFAVRGDKFDARFSHAGKTPGISGRDIAEITTDNPGINGTVSIDMEGTFLTGRPVTYIGRENTPAGLARSMLLRAKFPAIGNQGLFHMGLFTKNPANYLGCYLTSAGEIFATIASTRTAKAGSTTSGMGITTGIWYDIVLTWTGTTAANGFEIWVDGVRVKQDTLTVSLNDPFTTSEHLSVAQIQLGTDDGLISAHMSVDEVVVWDTIIDPTSIDLTSGSGSLNGASRTAYVEVDEYDGAAGSSGANSIGTGGIII